MRGERERRREGEERDRRKKYKEYITTELITSLTATYGSRCLRANCKIPKPKSPKVEKIVSEIEKRDRGTKRKNPSQIPTPLDKDSRKKIKQEEIPGIKKDISMDVRLANMEAMAIEERGKNDDLRDLMKQMMTENKAAAIESKSDRALTNETLQDLKRRVITLESGNTAKGDYSFKEQHKGEINKCKRSIKILDMRETVTEENIKKHLESSLNLTKVTMANMGMVEMFRLGKQPTKESDSCPPILVFFNTIEMAERILNAARSLGMSRIFKENIPAKYNTAYNEMIRMGIYFKETQGLTYRLKYEGHILQLQVKKPTADQYKTIDKFEPATDDDEGTASVIDLNDIQKPPEEDKRKLTFILGEIKMNTEKLPIEVPEEIIGTMDSEEATAMKAACEINVLRKQGNKITITCKTREDAVLLSN